MSDTKDNNPSGDEYKYEEITDGRFDEMINNSTHPEMQDIQPNEEFTCFNYGKLSDPIAKSLKDRIDKLKKEMEDDNEDKGDDGGAGVIARV
jgi:hypothetical protein